MFKRGVGDFKYFVGVSSLAQIATREDRVCVLNILGGESSDVTPIGHVYSGGNVVFGTSPGRSGQQLALPPDLGLRHELGLWVEVVGEELQVKALVP